MNHSTELDRLIQIARDNSLSRRDTFRFFEEESAVSLTNTLKTQNLFFSTSVLGMIAISHVIEDQALNNGGNYHFYAGFQKFSRFVPQQDRYSKLCQSGNLINVFGFPDFQPSIIYPNFKVFNVTKPLYSEEPGLSHYWFVILNDPNFVSMALVAKELPRIRLREDNRYTNSTKLIYRNFEGFWTYDQPVITEVTNVLDNYIKTIS